MCFSKVFGLSGPPKRVLGSGRPVRRDDDDDDDDENNDFQWFLNLNRPSKTRLEGVRSVISNF